MPDQKKTYYSNGKFLLTGEYFVLKGAKAIALPLRYGQKMEVQKGKEINQLTWHAYTPSGLWFSCKLQLPGFDILETTDQNKSGILAKIFKTIKQLSPELYISDSIDIKTYIDFNQEWGLGSSSTLVANLAKWASVDPYLLNELSFSGSGFDIACASAGGPVLYQKGVEPVYIPLNYSFEEQLYFVYSGSKKATQNEVLRFLSDERNYHQEIKLMNLLSEQIATTKTLHEFQTLIVEHENLVSKLLHVSPVKSQYFRDFAGEVKSLGAWGGDFYLIATHLDKSEVIHYFKDKGLNVIFPWGKIILNKA